MLERWCFSKAGSHDLFHYRMEESLIQITTDFILEKQAFYNEHVISKQKEFNNYFDAAQKRLISLLLKFGRRTSEL